MHPIVHGRRQSASEKEVNDTAVPFFGASLHLCMDLCGLLERGVSTIVLESQWQSGFLSVDLLPAH